MKRRLLRLLNRLLRPTRVEVVVRPVPGQEPLPVDFDARTSASVRAVQPFTMTSPERIHALIGAIEHIERHAIAGAVVECGVWRGGSVMAAARTLLALGATRDLYLYDTFEGMTPPGEQDRNYRGVSAAEMMRKDPSPEGKTMAIAGIDDVRRNIESTGYPQDRVHYVRGRVEDTIPAQAPERIALLRLDTDWYESTRHELEHLVPRIVPNGVLIIDDYGHWEGARRAVDEYFTSFDRPVLLCRVDYTGRVAVIPGR